MTAPPERIVLVTGATGSLGRAVVPAFASEDTRLGLVGTDLGRLVDLAASIGLAEDRWVPAVGDLRQPEEARAVAGAVVERFGRIDVLLHLVGGWAGGTAIVDLDPVQVRELLDQHLWTTHNVVQAVTPGMVERGWGRVVAVSSPFAVDPAAKMGAYAVAKAAEEILLRTLAREVAGAGVTANVLAVRSIDARYEREASPTPRNAAWTTPEEIASVMLFLCSDAAAAVNGVRLPLDGRG